MKINLFGDVWAIKNKITLAETLVSGDLTLFNLETPICSNTSKNKIIKSGAWLNGSFAGLQNIRRSFPNAVYTSLANNHILDYGISGATKTIKACRDLNIYCSGIGSNNDIQPMIINTKGNNICILSISEPQFGASQKDKCGVIGLNSNILKTICEFHKKNYFIIVSIHGGNEMIPWPYPKWQELYRNMINMGATVVYGHHSHVPQGFEQIGDGLVLYGMGNFIVPLSKIKGQKDMDWSLFVNLDVQNNKLLKYEIRPIKNFKETIDVCIDKYYEEYMEMANNILKDENLLNAVWQSYVFKMYDTIYKHWLKTTEKEKDFYQLWYHMFNCPSHAEAIKTYFGIKCSEIRDVRNELSNSIVSKYFKTL